MLQVAELIDNYIAAWNERDTEHRRALVAARSPPTPTTSTHSCRAWATTRSR